MKPLYIVLLLLAGLKPAFSDSALTFKRFSESGSHSYHYHIKDQQLRLLEDQSDLFNLFIEDEQAFISVNPQTGIASRIDPRIMKQHIDALSQHRLKKLADLEDKLKTRTKDMNDTEIQVKESLINQLKYPELYGAHTLLSLQKTARTKSINEISCDVYQVKRDNTAIKEACIATNQSLKLDAADYATLTAFQHFNDRSQIQLKLAVGKTDFNLIDYKKANIKGIPIEMIDISKGTDKLEIRLVNISRKTQDPALFQPAKH